MKVEAVCLELKEQDERKNDDCQKASNIPLLSMKSEDCIAVEEYTATAVEEISNALGKASSNFQTTTGFEKPNVVQAQTKPRRDRIWEQFKLVENKVFQDRIDSSSTANTGFAFVDHLMRLLNEDAEQIKDRYKHFSNIYGKNKAIFKKKLLDSYLKCRKQFQVAYNVYIPNLAQPDINPDEIQMNSQVPASKLKVIKKKYNKIITDQRNILYKSRCIAEGVALINRNALLKDGLYWEMKFKCHPSVANYQKGSKTLGDVFQKYCFMIGDEIIKHQKAVHKKPDDTLQKMILSIQKPLDVEYLASIYCFSNAHMSGLNNATESLIRKGSLTDAPPTLVSNFKRPISQVETVPTKSTKKLKGEEMLTIEDVINIISSSSESEDDGGGPGAGAVNLESSNSTAVDSELKFVDNLIKYRDKDTEELKNDYMQLIQKYCATGSFEEDSDLDAYLECREKLQIATGLYIPNVYRPDICPSDISFFESFSELQEETLLSETLKWSLLCNVESGLHKSLCIASGLSVLQQDPVLKRQVYHRLTRANKLSNNKSLKMLSTVLEAELYDIGRKGWDLQPYHLRCDKRDILSEVVLGISDMISINSSTSIYNNNYEPDAVQQKECYDQVPLTPGKTPQVRVNKYRMKLRSSGQAEPPLKSNENFQPQMRKYSATNKSQVGVSLKLEKARMDIKRNIQKLKSKLNNQKLSKKRKEQIQQQIVGHFKRLRKMRNKGKHLKTWANGGNRKASDTRQDEMDLKVET